MDSKIIAEELYRSFKSQVLWKDVDFKRIEKFKKIIDKSFILELNKIVNEQTPISEELQQEMKIVESENEELVVVDHTQHMSLLQRIVDSQDTFISEKDKYEIEEKNLKLNSNVIDYAKEHDLVEQYKKELAILSSTLEDKRYYIIFHCTAIISKPDFQVFKSNDIIEKDIRTDQITVHKMVFSGYIDTNNKAYIYEYIKTCFEDVEIVQIQEVDINVIPAIYKNIWQYRTKI